MTPTQPAVKKKQHSTSTNTSNCESRSEILHVWTGLPLEAAIYGAPATRIGKDAGRVLSARALGGAIR